MTHMCLQMENGVPQGSLEPLAYYSRSRDSIQQEALQLCNRVDIIPSKPVYRSSPEHVPSHMLSLWKFQIRMETLQ